MSYFDESAPKYLQRSQRGIWRYLRNREQSQILAQLEVKAGERILDVGCGAGFYARPIREQGASVTGIDVSSGMIQEFQRLGFQGHNISFESFEDKESFDKVLIAGSGEFIPSTIVLMRQIRKNLRPGGRAVV